MGDGAKDQPRERHGYTGKLQSATLVRVTTERQRQFAALKGGMKLKPGRDAKSGAGDEECVCDDGPPRWSSTRWRKSGRLGAGNMTCSSKGPGVEIAVDEMRRRLILYVEVQHYSLLLRVL